MTLDLRDKRWSFLSAASSTYLSALEEQFTVPLQDLFNGPNDSPPEEVTSAASSQTLINSLRALTLISNYQKNGHLIAQLNPLTLSNSTSHPDLELSNYGFTAADLEQEVYLSSESGFITLQALLTRLKQTYCQTVGIEFMHLQEPAQREWLQGRFEKGKPVLSQAQQKEILRQLLATESLEKFLHIKFAGAKRFGLEGGEALIPALEALLSKVANIGFSQVVMGMPHRGRIEVMANILQQPPREIFAQFKDETPLNELGSFAGDVKYHLGYDRERVFQGHKLHLSLSPNASHLESTNPIVLGKVRAKQQALADHQHQQVMGLLLHGDAAFTGQGIVAETLELSGLVGFCTGGTLHIIVNNQIGFTTEPLNLRSSLYSSDMGKIIQCPIFHVNGDDVEAVRWSLLLAADFRQRFAQDVILDLVCYRRHGHNESDDPAFTQPLMYQTIAQKPSVASLYQATLIKRGIITQAEVDKIAGELQSHWHDEFSQLALSPPEPPPPILTHQETGVPNLREIGLELLQLPPSLHLHPKVGQQLKQREQMLQEGTAIDWTTAETLALASLIREGVAVRFSGQDSRRGTFSQRHAVLVDQMTGESYLPLQHWALQYQTACEIIDSPLSEASVLGFEYGYSTTAPNTLVIWEAQFGDFVNGAQVIIDQFIVAGEAKWSQLSGLVMLLPHGLEGQGPEHSSGRLERFLQLCAQDNIQVANCSTPSNYFHILRRQIKGGYRKPLILMTPKSLLRHPKFISSLAEMELGTAFIPIIPDLAQQLAPESIRRVVLCSGKIYYQLAAEREKQQKHDIALIRIEQFYPLPQQQLLACLAPFKKAEIVWCQEEPLNMGAWFFIDRQLEALLKQLGHQSAGWRGIGRPAAATPASGLFSLHKKEQDTLIEEVLGS